MNDNSYKLERDIKNSDNEHISVKEFKKLTRKLDARMDKQNHLMTRDYEILEEKLKTSIFCSRRKFNSSCLIVSLDNDN
mgnify:CR=1 FL=1